jgi:7-cyano-7-deazaguanine synthase in queuosine biosynthesis
MNELLFAFALDWECYSEDTKGCEECLKCATEGSTCDFA